jgi:sarcosine oxidase subunit alpha
LQKIPETLSLLSSKTKIINFIQYQAGFMRIDLKLDNHRKLERGKLVLITINQEKVTAYEGELVSTVLNCEGIRVFQRKHKNGRPSGIYCGMGICYECLVNINGVSNVRACQTPVADGMIISTGIEDQA